MAARQLADMASAHATHLARRAAKFGVVLGSDVGGAPLHAAVALVFFAFGVGVGMWGGAAGAILKRTGVDAAAFGTILTLYTGAYLVAMSAGGARASFRRRTVACLLRDPLRRSPLRAAQRRKRSLGRRRPCRRGVPRRHRRRHHERRGRADRTATWPPDLCTTACCSLGRHGARRDSRQLDRGRLDALGRGRYRLAHARRRRRGLRSRSARRPSSAGAGRDVLAERIVVRPGADRAWRRHRRLNRGGIGGVVVVEIFCCVRSAKAGRNFRARRGVLLSLPGGAALQRRRDSRSDQRSSHHRRLVHDRGRRLCPGRRSGRLCDERRGLRLDRRRHRPDRPLRFCARCAAVGSRTRGRARLRLAVQRADPSARAAGDRSDCANSVTANRVCRLRCRAGGDGSLRGGFLIGESPGAFAAQRLKINWMLGAAIPRVLRRRSDDLFAAACKLRFRAVRL